MNVRHFTVGLVSLVFGVTGSWAATGLADIRGTAPNSPIKGTAHLEDTSGGLHLKAQLVNVPPGTHGFHIHEFGSCDDLGKGAGGHYNPLSKPHGKVLKDGVHQAHAGDMGNITAEANGNAAIDVTIPGVMLNGGKFEVAGRAIVLHEKADDFTQPVGNAGGRIGCGPILISGELGMSSAPAK